MEDVRAVAALGPLARRGRGGVARVDDAPAREAVRPTASALLRGLLVEPQPGPLPGALGRSPVTPA